jgi:hypothetical protein
MLGKLPLLAHLAVASRPDHVIMSSKVELLKVPALLVRHISDHCTMSLFFNVDDLSFNADWTLQTAHVCSSGGCGSNFVLKWNLRFMAKSWQTVQ